MRCQVMFLRPFCHSKWLLILIYIPPSRWQHLHMSAHHVSLIRHAQTCALLFSGMRPTTCKHGHDSYSQAHSWAHWLFYHFGQTGLAACGQGGRRVVVDLCNSKCVFLLTVHSKSLCLRVSAKCMECKYLFRLS